MATANHVLLRRITLSDTASSVTFDSIPQTGYTDLKIIISARDSYSGIASANYISFNGSTASFTNLYLQGSGAGPATGTLSRFIGNNVSNTATANTFSSVEIYIPNYTSSNNKSFSVDAVTENNATTAYANAIAGLWANTAAITSIDLTPSSGSYLAGSSFSLYGIADVNTTPTVIPKAMGGDIVKTDGTYWYHTFLSTGIFKPETNLTCDYLVVAGGGSGSGGYGAGGGAGGYRTSIGGTPLSLSANTNYTATVGAGGATQTAIDAGNRGSNSSFASITSTGGGGAGSYYSSNAQSGGSGGGGGLTGGAGNAGGYTPVEGYAGGAGRTDGGTASGGGGGAGGAGQNYVNNSQSGAGGVGASNSISGTATYYASGGGGGGDAQAGVTAGSASAGGGSSGSTGGNASAATANTGGGGGGGGRTSGVTYAGGAGGSGVIIIRYPV